MSAATRREIVAGAAAFPLAEPRWSAFHLGALRPGGDRVLTALWQRFLETDAGLATAWAAVERAQSINDEELAGRLVDWADAVGHEHDRIVRQIASRQASSWQGVTVKLLTWRRTADLSEFNLPDADIALAFSAYLDALRLCASAIGMPSDGAIARLAFRGPPEESSGAHPRPASMRSPTK